MNRLTGFFLPNAANDPEVFGAGLIALLAAYPRWALEQLCDVHHGMPSLPQHKFVPMIGEIREYLEALRAADRRHHELLERFNRPKLPPPSSDRSNRPTYEELKAKHGSDWGISEPDRRLANPQTFEQAEAKLRAEFGDAAFDAVRDAPLPKGTKPVGATQVAKGAAT